MYKVKIQLRSGEWLTISEMADQPGEHTKLKSVSSISAALNSSGATENSNCTLNFENISGFFTELTAAENPDRFLKCQPLEVYYDNELIFSGKISEIPEPGPGEFSVRADIFTGQYMTEINKKIKKTFFPTATGPKENKLKYGNIVCGNAETENGALTAYRIDFPEESLYLAAWHYLDELTGVFREDSGDIIDITADCTLVNDLKTGYAFVEYDGSDLEIYFNCRGAVGTNLAENGDFEEWLSGDPVGWLLQEFGESTVNQETDDVYQGLSSVRFDVDASNSRVSVRKNVSLIPEKNYIIRFAHKSSFLTGSISLEVKSEDFGVYLKQDGTWSESWQGIAIPVETEYTVFSIAFSAHPEYTGYVLKLMNGSASSVSLFLDRVEIYRDEMIKNPAEMFVYFCESFSPGFTIDTASIEKATKIYENRNYCDVNITVADGITWKKFFQRYFDNFMTYVVHQDEIVLIPVDWGTESPVIEIDAINIDWEKFVSWPDDTETIREVQCYFSYTIRGNAYTENFTIESNSGHQGNEKELNLPFHTNEASANDIAQRFLYRTQNPEYMYKFRLPSIFSGIQPGYIICLNILNGYFADQKRLVFVYRKRREKDGYYFECGDIQILGEGVIILNEDDAAGMLSEDSLLL